MRRIGMIVALVWIVSAVLVAPAAAQMTGKLRVARTTVIMETPRGDSLVLMSVPAGTILDILDRQDGWFLVSRPADLPVDTPWRRGWIQARFVQVMSGGVFVPGSTASQASRRPASADRTYARGFGQAGGTLFTAKDSFETILGSALGVMYGGGGQVGFPNGAFVQVGVTRFRKTGSRVLASGSQLFILDLPHVVTVTPIEVTAGFRGARTGGVYPYVGAGGGWHVFSEESPGVQDEVEADEGRVGYHVLGGVEYPLARWLWLAGEVRWAKVPGLLGDTGVSAVFEEDDLGGTAFMFKILVGR